MILQSPGQLTYTPTRIISLVPSQTELLYWLGLEEETIGITKFCIHPPEWHKSKARIGGTKSIDREKIRALKPDLIIANKEENIKEQVEAIATGCPVWVSDVNNLPDALQMIGDIGKLTGKTIKATELVQEIREAFAQLDRMKHHLPPAVYLIWKDPYMAVGGSSFIHDMMERAGFKNAVSHLERYPELDMDQLRGCGCKLLLLSSEPYPFKEKHVAALKAAIPGVQVILVDGEMFSWYGSRLLKAPGYFNHLASKILAL